MWQILGILGIVFFVLEIFTPAMFFINLAFASFVSAGLAVFISDLNILILSFVVFSAVFLLILKPFLMNLKTDKSQQTGIESKYIAQKVKVISPISRTSGVITIYGERWEARVETDEIIPQGETVKIIRNESLIMFVEKV